MRKESIATPSLVFAALTLIWAAPVKRAAQTVLEQRNERNVQIAGTSPNGRLPSTVRFRLDEGRGVIVPVWINGTGPFEFAVDTGVGTTLISERAATAANLSRRGSQRVRIGGLGEALGASGSNTSIDSITLGTSGNVLPSRPRAFITSDLPAGIDGVLEPAEAFSPLGFEIDFPRREIRSFDAAVNPIQLSNVPSEGAVVSWITDGRSRRPFVMLSNGQKGLIDTGSSLGFAMSESVASSTGLRTAGRDDEDNIRDISGVIIRSRKVEPATIGIGGLMLRHVPTEVLIGVERGAPTILGRAVLRPFRLGFDPLHNLIMIAPSNG